MENTVWQILYDRAKAVRSERKLSALMEVGSVGAAVLSGNGNIYTGICIDTACGMGMCAERNAIANMLSNGENKITKVVAVMPDGSTGTPCGVCREFMMQLGPESKDIEVLLSLEPLKTVKLGDQLPDWWGEKHGGHIIITPPSAGEPLFLLNPTGRCGSHWPQAQYSTIGKPRSFHRS